MIGTRMIWTRQTSPVASSVGKTRSPLIPAGEEMLHTPHRNLNHDPAAGGLIPRYPLTFLKHPWSPLIFLKIIPGPRFPKIITGIPDFILARITFINNSVGQITREI